MIFISNCWTRDARAPRGREGANVIGAEDPGELAARQRSRIGRGGRSETVFPLVISTPKANELN